MQNRFKPLLTPYFDWLTDVFGHLADEAIKNKIGAGMIAQDYLNNSTRRQHFQEDLPKFCSLVDEFWQNNSKLIDIEIRRLPGLKARFGGDIGPQASDAIFERAGLYFESIVVPDPLLRIARFHEQISQNKDFYFLKYSITHVILKEIYLTDVFPPLAILAGDVELEKSNIRDHSDVAKFDCVLLINELYETNFDNFNEVQDFINRFGSANEAIAEARKPELLYWDENASTDPLEQWEANVQNTGFDLKSQDSPHQMDQADFLLFSVTSRMLQANMVMFGASIYDANPLIAAPVSFHWLNWKIRLNRNLIAKNIGLESNLDLALTNALLSKDLNWLSNIPIEGLIELRRKGRLSELRSIINQETERLASSDLSNLEVIKNQVDYNLASALERHQEEIQKLDRAFRSEISTLGSSFLLSIAGAIQPLLLPLAPEWVATLSAVIGTTSLTAIVPATLSYLREKKTLGKSPIGILWQAKEHSHK
jgi:hypothetical protein